MFASFRRRLQETRKRRKFRQKAGSKRYRDFAPADLAIIERASPYSMTSWPRLFGLIRGTEYVIKNDIPGAFVECGVWKGGSAMAVALTLLRLGVRDRDIHLYDTFAGLPEPGEFDVSYRGEVAHDTWRVQGGRGDESDWCRVGVAEVRGAMAGTGYPEERIHCVAGKVEDTLPAQAPEEIGLLRLDTDWYESTRHELHTLYPLLGVGGVLIIDDYGYWQGARQAVDEFIREQRVPLLLNRLDTTGRVAVKLR